MAEPEQQRPAGPTPGAHRLVFPHSWQASVLAERPLIAPTRQHVYPKVSSWAGFELEPGEIELGALEVLVRPAANPVTELAMQTQIVSRSSPSALPFLATFALGFAEDGVPSGVWSCPHPDKLCAVSGGYAYFVNTQSPESWEQVPYRPVLGVFPVPAVQAWPDGLLLFAGHYSVIAYGRDGLAWESPRVTSEGLSVINIAEGRLHGTGWDMATDRDTAFVLDLGDGTLIA